MSLWLLVPGVGMGGIDAGVCIKTFTIGTASRDYATVQAWADELDDTPLYESGCAAVGVMYADTDFDEDVDLTLGSTVGLVSIKLTVFEDHKHDGTPGTGVRMLMTASRQWEFESSVPMTIEHIEIDHNDMAPAGSGHGFTGTATSTSNTVQRMLIHGSVEDGVRHWFFASGSAGNAQNNIIFGNGESGGSAGIYVATTSQVNVLNNTCYSIGGWGIEFTVDDTDHACRNNACLDNSDGDFEYAAGTTNITNTNNLSSDLTAVGTDSLISKVDTDQFVSVVGEDFHLKAGADCLEEALDQQTSPTGINLDIDEYDRDGDDAAWDIGADQLTVTAPPASTFKPDFITW